MTISRPTLLLMTAALPLVSWGCQTPGGQSGPAQITEPARVDATVLVRGVT